MGRPKYGNGDRSDATDRNKILKKQVEKLKIENARLRKEINKILNQYREQDVRMAEETPVPETKVQEIPCPKCNSSDTSIVKVKVPKENERTFLTCRDCGRKTRI